MAIGRISGPLLKSNLLRDGVDLAFENDLLYLKVTPKRAGNQNSFNPSATPPYEDGDPNYSDSLSNSGPLSAIGIKTDTPQYDLDVNGTIGSVASYFGYLKVDDIILDGSTITTELNDLTISAAATRKVIFERSVDINGDLYVTGNITADGTLTLGDSNTDNIFIGADIKSSLIPDVTDTFDIGAPLKRWRDIYLVSAEIGNIAIDGNSITALNSDGDIIIDANAAGSVFINNVMEVTPTSVILADTEIQSAAVLNLTAGRIVLAGAGSSLDDDPNLTFESGELGVGADIVPKIDGAYDIGTSTFKWRNFYVDNMISTSSLVGGDLTVEGNGFFDGNVTVGADDSATAALLTDAETFNLLPTNATTINLGAAATDINIGSFAGTTTVNNQLVVLDGIVVGAVEVFDAYGNLLVEAPTAAKLTTAREIALDGDLSGSAFFDGTANITITGILDTVNPTVGTFGSGTSIPVVSVNEKGLVTNITTADLATTLTIVGDDSTEYSINLLNERLMFVGTDPVNITINENEAVISVDDATTTTKGIASFDSSDFTVTNGNVELLYTTVTFGSTVVALGGTTPSINDLTQITVGDLQIDNNIIAGTATNGDIILNPNGTGSVDVSGARITNLAEPTVASDAATRGYVDNAVSGLTWKSSAHLLANTNVALTGATGTLIIDGHPALEGGDDGYRILLINQNTDSENGIYVYNDDSSTYTLTRTTDADTYQELIGAAIFIKEGTVYGDTGWVQSNHYITDFTNQDWVQFSGAGAYTAGAGLVVNGTVFSHADTSSVLDLTATANTFVSGLTFDTFGHVTAYTTGSATTYSQSAVTTTGGALLRLSGSDASTDDIKFASGTNVTVAYTDANTITISANDTDVILGTDTTGNYVATVASSGGTITVTGSGVETAAVNIDLPNTGVIAGSYGSTTTIPVLTVDAQGRITSASTATVATTLRIRGDDSSEDTVDLLNDVLEFIGNGPLQTVVTDDRVTFSIDDATTTTKGVASFSSNRFTVTSGAVDLADVNASVGSYGSATAIPIITVNSKGQITNVSTAAVASSLRIRGDDSSEDTVDLLNDVLEFIGNGPLQTTVTDDRVSFSVDDATTTTKGVASFSTNDFNVTSGAVTIKNVNLGTQTTGDYVATITGTENQVIVSGVGTEGRAVTLTTPQDIATTSSPTFANLSLTGELRGPATFVIDPAAVGDNTGTVVIKGSLQVDGTTTTVNSTVTTIDDPIFTLGGDTAPTIDDNKDRGVEFRWHDGASAKLGFFGFDDSTGKFTFIPDATNTSEVFSGTKGEIDANVDWANILNLPDPTITIAGDVDGSATMTNLGSVTVNVTLDTVNPSVGTYGSATAIPVITADGKGRITNITTAAIATSLRIRGDDSSEDTVDLLNDILEFIGNGPLQTTVTDDRVSFSVDDATTSTKGVASFNSGTFTVTSGAVDLANVNLDIGSYGSATAIPVITVNAKGQITNVDTAAIATSLRIRGDDSTEDTVDLLNDTLEFIGNGPLQTTVTDDRVSFSIDDATVTTKGVASFDTDNFTVVGGAVSAKSITLGTSTLSLGSTTTVLSGLVQLNVDNLRLDGNTISSTDSNGDIILSPNGTGSVIIDGIDIASFDEHTYYVSEDNGSDLNDGRRVQTAFQTLKYALTQAVAGDTILLLPGVLEEEFPLTVPAGVTVKGSGLRATAVKPTAGTNNKDAFLLNGATTVEDLTIRDMFYDAINDTGYAFRFAPGTVVNERSPYVQRVTVLNKGSVTTSADPYGFAAGDAGRGALLDGSQVTRASLEAAILFNECTFIVPNSRGIIMTNGARTEWLNCFTYFADLAIEGKVGPVGRGSDGKTYIELEGVTGTFAIGNTLSLYEDDGVTVKASGVIEDIVGTRYVLDGSVANFVTNTDRSNKPVTVNGDAKLSTAQAKFGPSSLALDGTGDFITLAANNDFDFGTGDFTVEGWFYRSVGGVQVSLFDFRTTATQDAPWLFITSGGTLAYYVAGSTRTSGAGGITTGSWHHVAVSRSGTSTRLFVNGTQVGSTWTDTTDYVKSPLTIGARYTGALEFFNGYIDEVRITKGLARYTGTFTPSASAFVGDSSTVLLLHMDGANNSTTILDDGISTQDVRSSAGGTATGIVRYDRAEFAAEMRSISSANVYGNQGVKADGVDVVIQLMAHNFAYIGTQADLTNNKRGVIQANEVIEVNSGRVYYNSVDQNGNFRIGDLFNVNFDTGAVTFSASNFDVTSLTGITFTDGTNTTTVNSTGISTGNLVLAGNTISTSTGPIILDPSGSEQIELNGDTVATTLTVSDLTAGRVVLAGTNGKLEDSANLTFNGTTLNVTGNIDVTGDVTVGGNIILGNQPVDTITVVADFTSNLVPDVTNTYDLGTDAKRWRTVNAVEFNNDAIKILGNTISTTESNANLQLDPSGTGSVDVSSTKIINLATPSDGTDAANKDYVDGAISAIVTTLTVDADTGTADPITLGVDTFTIAGTAGEIATAVTDNTVTISLVETGVVANTYGSATAIPVITVNANGQLTNVTTASIATSLRVRGDDSTEDTVDLLNDVLEFIGNGPLQTTVTDDRVSFSIDDATTTTKGAASFDGTYFTVTSGAVSLKDANDDAGTYGSSTAIPVITINAKGQVTNITTQAISSSFIVEGDTGEEVFSTGGTLSFVGGVGLTSVVTDDSTNTTVTFNLDDTTVVAGSYGSSSKIATFTVDAQGRITAAGEQNIATTLSIAGNTGTDTVSLITDTLTFTGTAPINTAITNNTVTISASDATTTTKGVASFSADNFDVAAGVVTIKDGGIANAELANSTVTFGTTTVSLGGTSLIIEGLDRINIDNIEIINNEIRSIDTNGNISLNPNGTGYISVNSAYIKNLANPQDDQDAATKFYVDNAITGLTWKTSVHLLANTNVALSGSTGTLIIDGHPALEGGDDGYRVLLINQSTASENGIYVYSDDSSTYTLTRATDADTYQELIGAAVFIKEGTAYANTGWVQSNHYITDFTNQEWVQFSGAGAYTAGAGLSADGTIFNVNVAANGGIEIVGDNLQLKHTVAGNGLTITNGVLDVGGTADRITVSANNVDIASTYVGQASITTLGTITSGIWNAGIIPVIYGGTGTPTGSITGIGDLTFTTETTNGNIILSPNGSGIVDVTGPLKADNITVDGGYVSFRSASSGTEKSSVRALVPVSITANTATTIDSWSATDYRTAKYVIQVSQGSKYQSSEVLVVHNGTSATFTEYAVVETNTASPIPMTISCAVSGGNVVVSATITDAASTNAEVLILRTLLAVA